MARLYALLRCPTCDSGLRQGAGRCGGCGRRLQTATGVLDLLRDDVRSDADHFAERYRALRVQEGWAAPTGQEDPDRAQGKRWGRRVQAVKTAAAVLEHGLSQAARPVVGDVGAGGGWAARFFPWADVIAFDLLDAPAAPGPALRVRADMRQLPLPDGAIDGLLYTAAIHHVPVDDAIREAARVLRPEGLLVAIESPMYIDKRAADQAAQRSAEYYSASGYPELARHYHPVSVRQLRAALASAGFLVERLDMPSAWLTLWRRLPGRHAFPQLVARLNC